MFADIRTLHQLRTSLGCVSILTRGCADELALPLSPLCSLLLQRAGHRAPCRFWVSGAHPSLAAPRIALIAYACRCLSHMITHRVCPGFFLGIPRVLCRMCVRVRVCVRAVCGSITNTRTCPSPSLDPPFGGKACSKRFASDDLLHPLPLLSCCSTTLESDSSVIG
jgi:hypothetical protein